MSTQKSCFEPGTALAFRYYKDANTCQDVQLTVKQFIAQGGQAEIYLVKDAKNHTFGMKYLYGDYASDKEKFYQKVALMSRFSSPSPQLAWPLAFSPTASKSGAFYYLMPFFDGYSEVSRIIAWLKRRNGQPGAVNANSPAFRPVKNRKDPNDPAGMTLAQRAEVIAGISQAVKAIHETPSGRPNYVYGDVSGKNFLYKVLPNGHVDVKVIDIDNLLPAGSSRQVNLGLIGTAQYIAPEVMLGGVPTIHSDLHSLGVLAFRVLLGSHPLDGALTHSVEPLPENIKRYYGQEPSFTITSKINCASRSVMEGWNHLPKVVQLYFSLVFSPTSLKSGSLAANAKEVRPTADTLLACIRKGFNV